MNAFRERIRATANEIWSAPALCFALALSCAPLSSACMMQTTADPQPEATSDALPFEASPATSCALDSCGVCGGSGIRNSSCTSAANCNDNDARTNDYCSLVNASNGDANCNPATTCCDRVCTHTCAPPNSGDSACNSLCAASNTYPNCGCTAYWQYQSVLEKRKRPMVGAAWVEHGTTRVLRYQRGVCRVGDGTETVVAAAGAPTVTFNHNHSSFWDQDAAASALVSTTTTAWTAAPPTNCFLDGSHYPGYCSYEGAAGCECATAYSIQNGMHVCNDDAVIQVSGFGSGYCWNTDPTCSDSYLRDTAPF